MTHILMKKFILPLKRLYAVIYSNAVIFVALFSHIVFLQQLIHGSVFQNGSSATTHGVSGIILPSTQQGRPLNELCRHFYWWFSLHLFQLLVSTTTKKSENRNCTGFGFAYLSCSELVLHIPYSRQEAKLVITNSTSARCMCRHIHETTVSGIGYILFIYSV